MRSIRAWGLSHVGSEPAQPSANRLCSSDEMGEFHHANTGSETPDGSRRDMAYRTPLVKRNSQNSGWPGSAFGGGYLRMDGAR